MCYLNDLQGVQKFFAIYKEVRVRVPKRQHILVTGNGKSY